MTPTERFIRDERRAAADRRLPSAMTTCAACGQTILTSPDDPPQTLFCDPCLFSLERRRETRRRNANLNQGGLF